MIKTIAATLGLVMVLSPINSIGNGIENDDSIITEDDISEITTVEEWNDYLDSNYLERDHSHDDSTVTEFRIEYNGDEQLIITDIVYTEDATATTTSGSATHEVRSTTGTLLFTLTVNGSFSRVSGSSCTCTSASGSFTHPITSLWRSTPSYSKGRVSQTKAYAKMYGTATQVIGTGSISYTFYLYCNSYGTLSSEYND
jgi:hypothetical protein